MKKPHDMTEREVISRVGDAKIFITTVVPFFGYLLARLRVVRAEPHHGVPTMGVAPDGTLYVNPYFLSMLTRAELLGVLCHEVMHLSFLCFERKGSRNMKRWNIAHDYAINLIISDFIKNNPQIKLPEGGLLDEKYRNMSAEEIYSALPPNFEDQFPSFGGASGGDGEEDPNQDGSAPTWGGDLRPDLSTSEVGKQAARGSDAAQRQLADAWKQATVTAARAHQERLKKRGNLPGGLEKFIGELLDPKVDWVSALSRWMGENGRRGDYTYRRPGRRTFALDVYMPSLQKHGVDDVIILWDTSGSMYGREKEIIPEMAAMCEDLNMSVRVIVCDMRVVADMRDCNDAADFIEAFGGGGGSDFVPAFELLEKEAATGVVVAFTDGYIGVPAQKPPALKDVLWVLWETHKDIDPSGGRWGSQLNVHADGSATFGPRAAA